MCVNFVDKEHLSLANNELVGTLPSDIGKLINLRVINLDHNDLTGTLSSQIGKLENLTELRLAFNNLDGSFPSEIGHCKQLEHIDITENNMGGTIPKELFDCRRLKVWDFYLNDFTGTIPTEISHLQDLWLLRLNSNNLSGKIPSEIGQLPSLDQMWLAFNDLTGTLPEEIGNLSSLTWLVANNNRLTGTIPDALEKLTLKVLQLSINEFTGTIPSVFWNEDYFAFLVQGNDVRGTAPDDFCSRVTHIQLDDSPWFLNEPKVSCSCCEKSTCYLWDINERTVKGTKRPNCPSSNRHNISFYEEYWITDNIANTEVHDFHGHSSIFDIEVCLSPLGCYSLRDDPLLSIMDYDLNYSESSNGLSKQDPCGTVDICGVSFDINHPRRSGLNHLTQLAMPDLSKLDDPSSPEYQALCWIMTEDILYDEFEICDGTLLQRFIVALATFHVSLRNLVDFDAFKHNHTCSWIGIVCDPDNLFVEELDLSNRALMGPIIPALGLLVGLKVIDLSDNHFTGTIDPFLFLQMPHLEVIHLGGNKLTGAIPKEVFMLPQLKDLNMSHNFLSGTLPTDILFSSNLGKCF